MVSRYAVVTSVAGSLSLQYDAVWGLNGTVSSNTSSMEFTSNHLAANTVMNYIAAFGMNGTSLQAGTNGSYILNGLQAGVTYGTMGNTGISGNPHVDFKIFNNSFSQNSMFSEIFKEDQYSYRIDEKWAELYSGLKSRNWHEEDHVREYMLKVYRQQFEPIWQLMQLMY